MRLSWLALILLAALMFVAPALTMVLWNWLMVQIFGLPTIGYFQAWGLMFLSTLMFYRPSSSSK